MIEQLRKLSRTFHVSGTVVISVIVVAAMLIVTVSGGVGQDFLFEPEDNMVALSYGVPEADGAAYDLSEEDESGKNIDKDSDRQKEQEPEEDTLGSVEEDVILPETMVDDDGDHKTVDAPISDSEGPSGKPGYDPQNPSPNQGNEENPDDKPSPMPGDDQQQEPKPGVDPTPVPNYPTGPSEDSGNKPDGGKVIVGGKEYDSIEDAMIDIADNQDKDKNDQGQYFEGFKKDENGNYIRDEQGNLIPSYSDKFDIGSGDVAMDYTGESGIYIVPSSATTFEMATIGGSGEDKPQIHTIVIPKQVTKVVLPQFGIGKDIPLTTIIVSKDNPYYYSEDGVLYDKEGQTLLYCPQAKEKIVKWPESLKAIGSSGFSQSHVKELNLPNTVVYIDDNAFNEAYCQEIVIPESVEYIGDFAFMVPSLKEGQESLSRTIILKGKTPPTVRGNTFLYISDDEVETKILIDASDADGAGHISEKYVYERYLMTWGMMITSNRNADGETALGLLQTKSGLQENYTYDEEQKGFVEKSTDRLVCWSDENGIYRRNKAGDTVLVKWIGTGGFVDLKETMEVEEGAFRDSSMMAIRIGTSVTWMGDRPFAYCDNLRVVIAYGEEPFSEELGAPEICSLFVKPDTAASYQRAWGQQVRKIYATSDAYSVTLKGLVFDSFQGEYRLLDVPMDITELNIPSYVKYIYDGAVKERTELVSVTGGTKVQVIGEEAFAGCTSLSSINLSSTITEIGDRAFQGCKSLVSASTSPVYQYLWLQNNVSKIGTGAFQDCTSLTMVYWYAETDTIPDSCFEGCTSLASWNWRDGAIRKIGWIGDRAFYGCSKVGNVLPNYMNPAYYVDFVGIGVETFYGCTSMNEVYLSSTVTTIGDHSFSGRGGMPLTLTIDATIPPAMGAIDTIENLTIYVPDSEGDSVYHTYLQTWKDWLGEEPQQILKIAGKTVSAAIENGTYGVSEDKANDSRESDRDDGTRKMDMNVSESVLPKEEENNGEIV
ncbi:MAG: leucine-rich repeat protein [Firmicutes bacterium]|nr:leucine-rich repeat protein [Bacillota bacterium]